DNDGHAEVIFASWPKKATGRVGQLHVLNYLGVELYRIDLPAPAIGATWNGSLSAPTIANIDSDPNLELVLGTVASGVVAYKLPNTTGARILWGTGRDNYGRTGEAITVASGDTTPPTVTMTSPASGVTVSGTISVTATASDNVSVVGVQFKLDGGNLGVENTTAPYAVSWNTTAASNASHTLTAVARDGAGNMTTSAAVTVTVFNDTTPPTVSLTAPSTGATVSSTVTVTASASDNVGVVGVQFKLDGANLGVEATTAPYSIEIGRASCRDTAHTLTAVARDGAGNTTTSAAVTVTVFNDTTPPTVSLTAPLTGATVSSTVTVTASASDNVGVGGVQFKLDGANLGVEATTAPYSIAWDTTTTSNASHTLTAVGRDVAGNTASSAAVGVNVSNGVTGPTVTPSTPTILVG